MSFPTKAIVSPMAIKDLGRGEVTAVVSVLNVVDYDRDVVLPGAIKDGTRVKLSSWGHDIVTERKPPAGAGVVTVVGNRAQFDGRYFLDTERGRDAFTVVKELGAECQWSVGFMPNVKTAPMTDAWAKKGAKRLIAGMSLLEVSPVFLGANPGTYTVTAKGELTAAQRAEIRAIDMRLFGDNLPTRFHRAREFACKELGLDPTAAPIVRVEPRWLFKTGNFLSEYDHKARTVRIAEGLPYETVVHALFHDLAYHAALLTKDAAPEKFATGAEGVLVRRWRAYQ